MNHAAGVAARRRMIERALRGYVPAGDDLAWMRDHGLRYHFMAEVERHGWDHVMERAIAEATEGAEYLYISLDIDVLDPAYAPGTGTPNHVWLVDSAEKRASLGSKVFDGSTRAL